MTGAHDDDPLAELVARIYEAGVDPDQLNAVAGEICGAVGADIMFSQIRRTSGEPATSFVRHGVPEQVLMDYAAYYWRFNPITPKMLRAPLDIIYDLYGLVPRGLLDSSETINDWALPMGLTQTQGWRGMAAPDRVLAVTVGRSSSRPWSDQDLERIARVAPYLSNAARLRSALSDAKEEVTSLRTLVDSIRCAAFLVDDCRRVVAANAIGTAMLRDGRLLRYEGSRLVAVDRFADRNLQRAIRGGVRGSLGTPVYLEAPSPTSPLAFVLPRSGHTDDREPGAVVLVPPPDPEGTGVEDWLRMIHGLTTAEAEVAILVASGDDLHEIADSREVSIGTVRNQVKRAMKKLGVRRREQLVGVIVGATGPLGSVLTRNKDSSGLP